MIYQPKAAWNRLNEMVNGGGNGNGHFRLTTAQIGVGLTFIGYAATALYWASHQESRISLVEASITENKRRINENDRDLDQLRMTILRMGERIDRQETPLSQRVTGDERRIDALDMAMRDLSNRVLVHEGRINELYNSITRRPP